MSVTPSVTHQKSVALSPKFPTLYTFVTNNNKIVLNDIIFKFKVIQPSAMEEQSTNTGLEKARKRTVTQERVHKYRASPAGPPVTIHHAPMPSTERVQNYQLKKQA